MVAHAVEANRLQDVAIAAVYAMALARVRRNWADPWPGLESSGRSLQREPPVDVKALLEDGYLIGRTPIRSYLLSQDLCRFWSLRESTTIHCREPDEVEQVAECLANSARAH